MPHQARPDYIAVIGRLPSRPPPDGLAMTLGGLRTGGSARNGPGLVAGSLPVSLDSALIDRQPIAYLDVDKKLYGFSSFWYPTTRGLEAVLLDTGFHNPRLTTGPNTLYSHPRITGSATADPNKTGPRVHSVYKHDFQTDDPMRAKVRRFIIRTINEVIGK